MNNIDKEDLFRILKNEIDSIKNSTIRLHRLLSAIEGLNCDMPAFLQGPEGQAVFLQTIMKLVSEQIIIPVGKPNNVQGLHLKYKVNKTTENRNQELIMQIARSIEHPATLDYYIKTPQDYINDKAIIDVISKFLKRKNNDFITVNERAYELFGDEKFFKGADKYRSRGETVLKRLGLNFQDLACEETLEPFFSFQKRDFHSLASRKIFIVENKDTFWSFKRNVMDYPSKVGADMLIYGEGKKIISSFKFIGEYEIKPHSDQFFYFGDLDAEGINIYCELIDEYPQYRIDPFKEGYRAVFEIGIQKDPKKTPKEQNFNDENIFRFIQTFEQPFALKLKNYLEKGFYIPQEALSAVEMKERFGNKS